MLKITAKEQNKERRLKKKMRIISNIIETILNLSIIDIGVPEEEEKEKVYEKIFEEIIVENFINMGNKIATHVQERHRFPYRINPWRKTPRHILIRLTKIKCQKKILKAAREKQK